MRPHGKAKLGFFPLPIPEAERLRNCLAFGSAFSALDPCVGDGAAFSCLLNAIDARRYGVEIDANRTEQARSRGIETLHANTMDVRCPVESTSLLYLNPPYDFEVGETNNQRLELVFLEHTYRWLKPGGVLLGVIPQPQLKSCARILSEHFADLTVFRLSEPACIKFRQIAVIGTRRRRHQYLRDSALLESLRWLEMLALKADLPILTDAPTTRYECLLPGRSHSRTQVFPWMKSRICCSILQPTGRQAESCSPDSGTAGAGRSRRSTVDMWGYCARQECSMACSAKEKIATSLTGAQ